LGKICAKIALSIALVFLPIAVVYLIFHILQSSYEQAIQWGAWISLLILTIWIFSNRALNDGNDKNKRKSNSSEKDKPLSKTGILGLAVGAFALSKVNSLSNPPSVWFEGCSLGGGDAQVVGVKPRGSRWEVSLRIKQSHMPSSAYSNATHTIDKGTVGFYLGSLKFGVKWD